MKRLKETERNREREIVCVMRAMVLRLNAKTRTVFKVNDDNAFA